MKFLVLIGIIYAIYKYSTLISKASSLMGNKRNEKIDHSNDDEYVDYEEVD